MSDYSKSLVEVEEILNYLSIEDYKKIPEKVFEILNKNKDPNYIWKYDESKRLNEQNLSNDTIAILSYINLEYLLNDKQKLFMENVLKENEIHEENLKREIYNTDTLFKKKNKNSFEYTNYNQNLPVEVKKEGLFTKIYKFLKSLFKI